MKECKRLVVVDVNGKAYDFNYPQYKTTKNSLIIKQSDETAMFFLKNIISIGLDVSKEREVAE